MSLVFFYPQFKKLTGAERLILKLADYVAREPKMQGKVVILTHRMADECRPALSDAVRLVETGWPMKITHNHYLDAAIEYALGPALAMKIPRDEVEGLIFFGPPSVPAMWFVRRILFKALGKQAPVLYFCFEPPRFIYRDTDDIVKRLGVAGTLLRPLFSLYRGVDRRLVRSADRVLSNSPFGSRKLWEAYKRCTTVIEHGVDFMAPKPEQVEHLRERYGLHGRKVAVTVNHLHPRKRVDLFLRAVQKAGESVPGATALVVGGGPERAELEALAARLGLVEDRDVIFTGAVPEAELPAHYALGNVYVHTGREESFGLSVIEALSLGLPVVAVAEGGPCDTVQDGVSGYLVAPEADALGVMIARLLADDALSRQMGEAGARFVATHFRWERGAQTLLRVMDAVESRLRSN